MLRVRNLDVYYGMVHALRTISIHVRENEIVALIGSNGAGKTTLLTAISALTRPSAGEIFLDGKNVTNIRPDKLVKLGIAHVPEGRRIFKPLTVEDNLLLGSYPRYSFKTKATIRKEIDEIFALFPRLAERRDQISGTLSGGEQQMLAIGRALLSKPKVLLLDEPSMGLAPKIIKEIFAHVETLRRERGLTILLVEQNAKAALKIADRGYVIETGRIVTEGTGADLLSNREVQRAYLGADH